MVLGSLGSSLQRGKAPLPQTDKHVDRQHLSNMLLGITHPLVKNQTL